MVSLFKVLICAIPIILLVLKFGYHINFKFYTLFRKGFKKTDDTYGVYTWVRQTTAIGKTYSVIDFLNEITKRDHKKIITNVKSFASSNKDIMYEPSFYKIIEFINTRPKGEDRNYIIFFDELFTLLEKGKLDKSVLTFISQLRKRGIYLVTTVQEWLDINVTFRRYCRYFVECKMKNLFGCCWSINTIKSGYEMKWDKDLNEFDAPILETSIKKCGKAIAESYDTLEIIDIK